MKKINIIPLLILLFTNFLLAQDSPLADAGDDITVSSGCTESVILDGRESTGINISYLWFAIDGCAVLTDFDEDTLIFEIPPTAARTAPRSCQYVPRSLRDASKSFQDAPRPPPGALLF